MKILVLPNFNLNNLREYNIKILRVQKHSFGNCYILHLSDDIKLLFKNINEFRKFVENLNIINNNIKS